MQVKLPEVRLAFPELFVPKTVQGEGEPAYSATFLIPKKSPLVAQINDAIEAVALEKWGAKATANLKTLRATDKVCLRDGDIKSDYAGFDGHFYIAARNKIKPTVIDRRRNPLTAESGVIYAGCYVLTFLDIWAMDNQYGKRVCASLGGVQFVKDGQAFSGGRAVDASQFDDLGDDDESVGEGEEALI
jgi:Protein of unknown function (DUF2815)